MHSSSSVKFLLINFHVCYFSVAYNIEFSSDKDDYSLLLPSGGGKEGEGGRNFAGSGI